MGLFDFIADVITLPITIPIKAVEYSIKAVEAVPTIVEKGIDNIEKAINKIGE